MNDQQTNDSKTKNSEKADDKPSKADRVSGRGKTFEGKGTEKKG